MSASGYQFRVVAVIATTPWLFKEYPPIHSVGPEGIRGSSFATVILIPLAGHSLVDRSAVVADFGTYCLPEKSESVWLTAREQSAQTQLNAFRRSSKLLGIAVCSLSFPSNSNETYPA